MKKFMLLLGLLIIAVAAGLYWQWNFRRQDEPAPTVTKEPMLIFSTAFGPGSPIPQKYTCDGEDINPPLGFSGVPKKSASLVLIMDDPDATGGWVHWVLWNIEPAINNIAENSVPEKAIQGQTSSGKNAYGGPCPPSGQHRYFFKLFALDAKVDLPSFADKAKLETAMAGHIIAQAELMGTYGRPSK